MIIKGFGCNKRFYLDSDILIDFGKENSHKIIIALSLELNSYGKELEEINRVIKVLTRWKKEQSFYTNKTTYEMNIGKAKEVTLTQAKALFKETKIKHDTLLKVFEEVIKIYYEESPNELDKYFIDIEI